MGCQEPFHISERVGEPSRKGEPIFERGNQKVDTHYDIMFILSRKVYSFDFIFPTPNAFDPFNLNFDKIFPIR